MSVIIEPYVSFVFFSTQGYILPHVGLEKWTYMTPLTL